MQLCDREGAAIVGLEHGWADITHATLIDVYCTTTLYIHCTVYSSLQWMTHWSQCQLFCVLTNSWQYFIHLTNLSNLSNVPNIGIFCYNTVLFKIKIAFCFLSCVSFVICVRIQNWLCCLLVWQCHCDPSSSEMSTLHLKLCSAVQCSAVQWTLVQWYKNPSVHTVVC